MKKSKIVSILADTHDNRLNIQKSIELFNKKNTDLVIHAGDIISPFTSLDFRHSKAPMEIVFGNNDGEKKGLTKAFKSIGNLIPGPREFTFEGKKFVLMHDDSMLKFYKRTKNIDVIIYGHTHKPLIEIGKPLIINPGECGGWLTGKSTVALLNLDTMEAEIVELPA